MYRQKLYGILVRHKQRLVRDGPVVVARYLYKPYKVSRAGLPVGGDLEYADGVTIAQALSARRAM